MTRYRFKFGARAAVALLFVSLACGAETPVANTSHRVAGEKLDSGLGELPHYREWADNTGRQRGLVGFANR